MEQRQSFDQTDLIVSRADNLKLIRGIGPNIERRLRNAGIHTFDQLAAMSPIELANQIGGISADNIAKQGWTRQARKLASQTAKAVSHEELASRQHYATFTVELLLDEENNVRRTRMVHVQTGEKGGCAGWDEAQVAGFVVKNAALHVPNLIEPAHEATAADLTSEPARVTDARATPEPTPIVEQVALPNPAGPRVSELTIVPIDGDAQAGRLFCMLRSKQPYTIRLMLDFAAVDVKQQVSYNYDAEVCAKQVGTDKRQLVGRAKSTINRVDGAMINLDGTPLKPGAYRLEAVVSLRPSTSNEKSSSLTAWAEKGLLQVY